MKSWMLSARSQQHLEVDRLVEEHQLGLECQFSIIQHQLHLLFQSHSIQPMHTRNSKRTQLSHNNNSSNHSENRSAGSEERAR